MGILDTREYFPECKMSDSPIDEYFCRDKSFGHFSPDGSEYIIEDRNTPRPWLQYLCNDKIICCVSNAGEGFIRTASGFNVTKEWEPTYYHVRHPSGKRSLIINGKSFFDEAEDYKVTVRVGGIVFEGTFDGVKIKLEMFVPEKNPCECWRVEFENTGEEKTLEIEAGQEWYFSFLEGHSSDPINVEEKDGVLYASKAGLSGLFASSNTDKASHEKVFEKRLDGLEVEIEKAYLSSAVTLSENGDYKWYVVSGVVDSGEDMSDILSCANPDTNNCEYNAHLKMWERLIERNVCTLPDDKNTERFLNFWLKNQLFITYRYNRGTMFTGYRDAFQDSWGYMLIDPEKARESIITTLSYMLPDGRCPRQYYKWDNKYNDMRDFSDSIIWVADAVVSYIKETGNTDILDFEIGFLDSDEKTSVEEHIMRGFDSLWNLRGESGLTLMRGGDWFDGLGGINKYGEGAVSVWNTIAVYYAQKRLSELYEYLGKDEAVGKLKDRNEAYYNAVQTHGWDGNWFLYAYFEDGEPIGSHKNLEGKIYINPQSWAIFSGIATKEQTRRIVKATNHYLTTPYGYLLNYPAYNFHGARCGRVQRQRPGTFGNAAVYNHASSFKVFADVARGDYDDAIDTLQRLMPNHPDNSDTCRTSEPYCLGNVFYGPNHSRYGMNLFTWFTATPAWAIHGGFEEIIGVRAGFEGLEITPHIPTDWNKFTLNKIWRDTLYKISFERGEDKGIWIDGVKQTGCVINSDKAECDVVVKY